jgi:hypothetical protein
MQGWKRGLPPGKYYVGMTDDFEVYFSPGGIKWHRRRSSEEVTAIKAARTDEIMQTFDPDFADSFERNAR